MRVPSLSGEMGVDNEFRRFRVPFFFSLFFLFFFFFFVSFYYEFTNVSSPCLFQTIFQTRIDSAATLALRAAGSLTDCDTLCRYHEKTTPSSRIVPVSPLAMRIAPTALVRAVQTIRNV